jgi:hypothetical protein
VWSHRPGTRGSSHHASAALSVPSQSILRWRGNRGCRLDLGVLREINQTCKAYRLEKVCRIICKVRLCTLPAPPTFRIPGLPCCTTRQQDWFGLTHAVDCLLDEFHLERWFAALSRVHTSMACQAGVSGSRQFRSRNYAVGFQLLRTCTGPNVFVRRLTFRVRYAD